MATIRQVLSIQERIDKLSHQVKELRYKRNELVRECKQLPVVPTWGNPAEVFTTVDGKPCRIRVYTSGTVEKEVLPF